MIGTDLVDKRRISASWQRYGLRFARFVLHPEELQRLPPSPERFLAMRWAAKEALGKALQTGLRDPVLMSKIAIRHHEHGAPYFHLSPDIEALLQGKKIALSLSDERDYALAFVMLHD